MSINSEFNSSEEIFLSPPSSKESLQELSDTREAAVMNTTPNVSKSPRAESMNISPMKAFDTDQSSTQQLPEKIVEIATQSAIFEALANPDSNLQETGEFQIEEISNSISEIDTSLDVANEKEAVSQTYEAALEKTMTPYEKDVAFLEDSFEKSLAELAKEAPSVIISRSTFPQLSQDYYISSNGELMTLYERDKLIIEKHFNKSLARLAKDFNGEHAKLSRRDLKDLTHSYILTPEGELLKQLHKTQGLGASAHVKDVEKVIIGKGGFKIASGMADETGKVTHVRSVVFKEGANTDGAIEASKNQKFQANNNLLVGHYMTYVSQKTGDIKEVFISNYVEEGSLENKTYIVADARTIMKSVGLGLKTVHEEGWAHLDLKPGNIFGDKLADFDLARRFTHANRNTKISCGTPGYQSPEMLRGQCVGKAAAQGSDMYAFGVTMLRICGFSLRHTVQNELKTKNPHWDKKRLEMATKNSLRNLDEDWLDEKIEEFKQSLGSLSKEDNVYLDLAFDLVNCEGDQRPNIYEVLDLLA